MMTILNKKYDTRGDTGYDLEIEVRNGVLTRKDYRTIISAMEKIIDTMEPYISEEKKSL